MIWPFNRKRASPRYVPAQTGETWRAGDIAECVVFDGPWLRPDGTADRGPEAGQRYIVRRVELFEGNNAIMLKLVGWAGCAFCACAFRKIVDVGVEEPKRLAAPVPRKERV